MNVDYNKHNIVKYLANNKDKDIWKMSVSSIGFQSTKFLDSYPPKGHPFGYTFNPERGRILLNLYYKRERNISVRQLFRKKNN